MDNFCTLVIIHIFSKCSTITDAVNLSSVNKHYRSKLRQFLETFTKSRQFRYLNLNESLISACQYNDNHIIQLLLSQGATISQKCLIALHKLKRTDVIEIFKTMKETLVISFKTIHKIGDLKMMEELIENSPSISKYDFKRICKMGSVDLIKTTIKWLTKKCLRYGLEGACVSGDLDCVKLLIKYGADNFNGAFYYACKGGNMEVIELLIENGATYWNTGLEGMCQSKNKQIVDALIRYITNSLEGTSTENNQVIVQILKYKYINLNPALFAAATRGNEILVELLIRFGANAWNDGLLGACHSGNIKIARMVIKNIVNIDEFLRAACIRGFPRIIKLLSKKVTGYLKTYYELCIKYDNINGANIIRGNDSYNFFMSILEKNEYYKWTTYLIRLYIVFLITVLISQMLLISQVLINSTDRNSIIFYNY